MSDNKAKKAFTIALEGNIGAGKTRFINYLKEQEDLKHIVLLDEQVNK